MEVRPLSVLPTGRPLRIAQICPYSLSHHGGVQAQVFGLARTMRHLGHEVAVIGPCDGEPLEYGVFDIGPSVSIEANGSIAPIAVDRRSALRTLRIVRSIDCDVIHLHEPLVPGPCLTTLIAKPTPLVGTFHLSGDSASYAMLNRLVVRWARHLDFRCAVSDEARSTAFGSLGGEYRVLFNGVDVERFARHRVKRGTTVGPPVIAFVGRHEERKGLSVLLEAFCALEGEAVLRIAGDGPDSDRLRRSTDADERIQWLGRIDDEAVARLMGTADVVCAPSLGGESFGIVVVEALAAGASVVASDIPGYRAVAGDLAVLFPPGNVTALAAALRGAIWPRDRKASPGGMSPVERFSLLALAHAYLDVYHSL